MRKSVDTEEQIAAEVGEGLERGICGRSRSQVERPGTPPSEGRG